jgi:cytochrome c-type biogenesis protein CcmH/NrfF
MKGFALALLALCFAAPASGRSLEEQARALEGQLIAPCCWRQPVSEHISEESDRLKREIRFLLQQGRTEEQALDHYVQQYGQAILAKPPLPGLQPPGLYPAPTLSGGPRLGSGEVSGQKQEPACP